jgi:SAM-dependent methyltransferase
LLLQGVCICPDCHGNLTWSEAAIDCHACGRRFGRKAGIAVFSTPLTEGPDAAAELKRAQADFFDSQSTDWEIDRPTGAPALYGWLMMEKFRRSLRGLEAMLQDGTVLTTCGGSGMDAEFLARKGARVIASDLSIGAAIRTRERARRYGLDIVSLVADAEALPFRTGSVDIAYVHDGLHHLKAPEAALCEMARVARHGVSLTEPAQAAVTAVAVRLGLALEVEESGNRVQRLGADWVATRLQAHGWRVVGADRYAMYYRHVPGPAMRLLSRTRLLPGAKAAVIAANRLIGPAGNKLSVRAVPDAVHGVRPQSTGWSRAE